MLKNNIFSGRWRTKVFTSKSRFVIGMFYNPLSALPLVVIPWMYPTLQWLNEPAPNVDPSFYFLNAWQCDIRAASSICAPAWRREHFFAHRGRHLLPSVSSPAWAAHFFLSSAHGAYDCTLVLHSFFMNERMTRLRKLLPAASGSPGQAQSRLHQLLLHLDQRMVSRPLMIMRSLFLEEQSRSLTCSTVCCSGRFNSSLRPSYANLAELAHPVSFLSLLKLISILKIWLPVRNIASTLHVYATCISKAGSKWGGGGVDYTHWVDLS